MGNLMAQLQTYSMIKEESLPDDDQNPWELCDEVERLLKHTIMKMGLFFRVDPEKEMMNYT